MGNKKRINPDPNTDETRVRPNITLSQRGLDMCKQLALEDKRYNISFELDWLIAQEFERRMNEKKELVAS